MEIRRFEVLFPIDTLKLRLVHFLCKLLKYFEIVWTVASIEILVSLNSFELLVQIGQVIAGIVFEKGIFQTALIFKVLNKYINFIIFQLIFPSDSLINFIPDFIL